MNSPVSAAILAAIRTRHVVETPATVKTVQAPAPGVAVMACECGRMLDLADMRWSVKLLACVVPRIVCADCVRNRPW